MNDQAVIAYVGGIALALVGVIWTMLREQTKHHTEAIDKKASLEALKEAKDHFESMAVRMHADFQERIRDLSLKQDKEIDWLKDELQRFNEALAEMRRENNLGQTNIMNRLDTLMRRQHT